LASHSRADSGQSIDAESQAQNVTASSQRRKNINDHGKAQKKSKGEKSQAIHKFLTEFALSERPEILPI
jgi:metal-dependent HD superfamily phosphatase/phosphodiesterase